MEDYLGDMDFKIAGGRKGFTALQADIKITGVPLKIIMEAIDQAKIANQKIITIMDKVLLQPRKDHNDKMPVVEDIEIPVHQRGKFLGVGGTNLKKLLIETGVHVCIIYKIIILIFSMHYIKLFVFVIVIRYIQRTMIYILYSHLTNPL